jgi:hypothetical protein
MRMPISKEQFVAGFKKSMNYAIIIGGLAIGFQIGRYVEKNQKSVKEETNPYSKAFSPEEISIAVNEGNELILIEKATGRETGELIKKFVTAYPIKKKRED